MFKRIRTVLYGTAVLFLVYQCSIEESRALRYAGDNRVELEKVINHYRDEGDTQKLEAAKFLIKNMPMHCSLTGDLESYYDAAEGVLNSGKKGTVLLDSLQYTARSFGGRIHLEEDVKAITAEYLIDNIDLAFSAWRDGPWARFLSFENFCEYMLPYTLAQGQPIMDWRREYKPFAYGNIDKMLMCYDYDWDPREPLSQVNNSLKKMIDAQEWINSPHGFTLYRPEQFVRLPGATCEEYCQIGAMIMLSKGFPVTIDYTPQWADRPLGHSWCTMFTIRGKNTMFNPFETNPFQPVLPYAKFPKVLRRTYSANREYVKLVSSQKLEHFLPDPFFEDVTEEYYKTYDYSIKLMPGAKASKCLYLGLFNCKEWKPSWYGIRRGRKALFKNMGTNFTGIVLARKNGEFIPVSYPFVVDINGNVSYIHADTEDVVDFIISRKTPMYQHVYRKEKTLHGGAIEASDTPDFKDGETVARLPKWGLISGSVTFKQTRPYRYWRFVAGEGNISDMAELFFFDADGERLRPKVVNPTGGFKMLVDSDALTFFSSNGIEYNGSLDMEEPVTLEHISFIRRGDGNDVFPEDDYELYYWDDHQMVLFDTYTPRDVSFTVSGIPADRLYYVKCTTRGVQQRIFEYDRSTCSFIWH